MYFKPRMLPCFGLLQLAFLTLSFIPEAKADFFLHSWEDHYTHRSIPQLGLSTHFLTSSSNYDGAGTLTSPSGLQNYVRLQTDLNFSYGFTSRLSLFGRGSWAYINQNSNVRPGIGYGLTDQTLGGTFRVSGDDLPQISPVTIDIQFQVDFPGYNNATSDTNLTPYLGDGSVDVTSGAFLLVPVHSNPNSSFKISLGAGYTYRTAGFSSALPWCASLIYTPSSEGFYAKLGGVGVLSLKTDLHGVLGNTPRTSLGSGGSFITGGTNPSLIQIQGRVGYKIDRTLDLFLEGSQTLWGQAVPYSLIMTLGLQARLNTLKTNPVTMSPKEFGQSNRGFLNYSLDAHVLKSNDRLNLVKIDKGSQDGVEEGQIFDIFRIKNDGSTSEAIARTRVSKVKIDETALEIMEFYKEVWIDTGFIAKRLIQ